MELTIADLEIAYLIRKRSRTENSCPELVYAYAVIWQMSPSDHVIYLCIF